MDELSLMQKFADPELIHTLSSSEKAAGSLVTALMGMGITFVVLMLLWGIVALMAKVFQERQPVVSASGNTRGAAPVAAIAVATTPGVGMDEPAAALMPAAGKAFAGASALPDAELVAVLAAAISASTGQSTDSFVVRKITRLSGGTPSWALAGRGECIDSRRM